MKKTIHHTDYTNFIALLKSERVRLNLSQKETSQFLGISQSDLSKIESCERRLDILELKKIIHFYRIKQNSSLQKSLQEFLEVDFE